MDADMAVIGLRSSLPVVAVCVARSTGQASAGDEEVTLLTHRLTPGLGAYAVLIIVRLVSPVTAVIDGCLAGTGLIIEAW
jgi:hypothetical protein